MRIGYCEHGVHVEFLDVNREIFAIAVVPVETIDGIIKSLQEAKWRLLAMVQAPMPRLGAGPARITRLATRRRAAPDHSAIASSKVGPGRHRGRGQLHPVPDARAARADRGSPAHLG
jgi:hypothetical protein